MSVPLPSLFNTPWKECTGEATLSILQSAKSQRALTGEALPSNKLLQGKIDYARFQTSNICLCEV